MIYRNLPTISGGVVLDVHCASGRTTTELLSRLDDSTRVIALDPSEPNLALARARMRPQWKKRVYFKPGDVTDVTAMGDDSYDATVANLVLSQAHDWPSVVAELVRVTRPGGEVLATLPMHGSWAEVEDLFYEVLLQEDLPDAMRRLSRLAQLRPTGDSLAAGLKKLGMGADDFVVEADRFQLLFPSGREFLFAPSVEHGPLRLWKAIISGVNKPQELFWRLKEAIDVYYAERVFAVTVCAGLLRIGVPQPESTPLGRRYWGQYPVLDAIFRGHASPATTTADADDNSDEFDVDMDLDLDIDLDEEPESVDEPERDEPVDDEEIFTAMEEADEDSDIESMLDDVFQLADQPPTPSASSTPVADAPTDVPVDDSATRPGQKIGSASPQIPLSPSTGPRLAHPSGSSKKRRRE